MGNAYSYDKIAEPDLLRLESDIDASSMENRAVIGCTWHERLGSLIVEMDDPALTPGDKSILDGIVASV